MNQNGEFKGIYYNDSKQQQFFEGGAHFSYMQLCRLLERIQSPKSQKHKIESNSQRLKPKTRNAKSMNDFEGNDSRNIHTFDMPKHSNMTSQFQFNKNMNLSMYNNVYIKRNLNADEEEARVTKKQISIIKSTHSNTRNSNNCYDKDFKDNNSTTHNCNKPAISMCSGSNSGYTRKEKQKIIIPSQVFVQQMITNSKKMLQFTSRIKENLSKPKPNIPFQIQTQKQYFKPNTQVNKVDSIDFDKIGLRKKSDSVKSRNQHSQRDYKVLNPKNNNHNNDNNSLLRGNSVEKQQAIGKTIDFVSRNKMSSQSIAIKQKTSKVTNNNNYYKKSLCRENSNYNNEASANNCIQNPNSNSLNCCKANKQSQYVHSNYAQKYLKKILRNSFEINKRIASSKQPNPFK